MSTSDALKKLLSDARLPDTFCTYCQEQVGLETVENYVSLVTVSGYEKELKDSFYVV